MRAGRSAQDKESAETKLYRGPDVKSIQGGSRARAMGHSKNNNVP